MFIVTVHAHNTMVRCVFLSFFLIAVLLGTARRGVSAQSDASQELGAPRKGMSVEDFMKVAEATEDIRASAPALGQDATLGDQYEWLVKYLYGPANIPPPAPPTPDEWNLPLRPNLKVPLPRPKHSDKSTRELIDAYAKARKVGREILKDHELLDGPDLDMTPRIQEVPMEVVTNIMGAGSHTSRRAEAGVSPSGELNTGTMEEALPDGYFGDGWEHSGKVNSRTLEDGTMMFTDETRFMPKTTIEVPTPLAKGKEVENEDGTTSIQFDNQEDLSNAIKYLNKKGVPAGVQRRHVKTTIRPLAMTLTSTHFNTGRRTTFPFMKNIDNAPDTFPELHCSGGPPVLYADAFNRLFIHVEYGCNATEENSELAKDPSSFAVATKLFSERMLNTLAEDGLQQMPLQIVGACHPATEIANADEAFSTSDIRCIVSRMFQVNVSKMDAVDALHSGFMTTWLSKAIESFPLEDAHHVPGGHHAAILETFTFEKPVTEGNVTVQTVVTKKPVVTHHENSTLEDVDLDIINSDEANDGEEEDEEGDTPSSTST